MAGQDVSYFEAVTRFINFNNYIMVDYSYVLLNPPLTKGTESVMLIFSLLAIHSNVLALYITVFRLRLRTASVGLMAIIALTDILTALAIIINEILKYATSREILNNDLFCQRFGMISMLFPMSSVDGIGLLSLVRALSIVKNIEIQDLYWYLAMGIMFSYNLIINVLAVSNHIMKVTPSQIYCHALYDENNYSKLFSTLLLAKFLIMFIISIVSYICITIRYYKTVSRLKSKRGSSSECFVEANPTLTSQKMIIFRLVAFLLMYMICFVPQLATTAHTVITKTPRSAIADAISGATISLSLLANSIFVLFYQIESREIILNMLPRWIYTPTTRSKPYKLGDF